mmetsp:Transcript_86486/g.244379  ORF Transcript_86486/g.244379 Transcript_86486/m.244379 type:complete len:231 (+) Transcript_86486:1402-2094(+)
MTPRAAASTTWPPPYCSRVSSASGRCGASGSTEPTRWSRSWTLASTTATVCSATRRVATTSLARPTMTPSPKRTGGRLFSTSAFRSTTRKATPTTTTTATAPTLRAPSLGTISRRRYALRSSCCTIATRMVGTVLVTIFTTWMLNSSHPVPSSPGRCLVTTGCTTKSSWRLVSTRYMSVAELTTTRLAGASVTAASRTPTRYTSLLPSALRTSHAARSLPTRVSPSTPNS